MLDLCRGANYVPVVKAWMQSASLLGKHESLTEYAPEIVANFWLTTTVRYTMTMRSKKPTANKTEPIIDPVEYI